MTSSDDKTRLSSYETPRLRFTELLPGQMFDNRYQVVSKLGQGGMGLVYRVKQVLLDKEFALKTIEPNMISPAAIRRFQQEARATFALDHPNIIAVKDFGVLANQTPFLVMELVNGEHLGERIKRVGSIPLNNAIPIFVQICFGLAYAHECGIVHRDVKPGNIMLMNNVPEGTDGSIKILDFGIAKLMAHEGGEIQALTRTGEIFGSPMYMSPEQCSGLNVDHRADIYSLGCVFYEVLTGAPPCVGENALSTMMKHQTEIPLTLKQASMGFDFPSGIEEIIARMLAKSPDQRYQSLSKVANDLGALNRGDFLSLKSHEKSKKTPTNISMTVNQFCLMLFVIIISTIATTEIAHSIISPNLKSPQNSVSAQDQKQKTADSLSLVPAIEQTADKQIDKVPEPDHTGPIRSTIGQINGEERRQFFIPDEQIGISDATCYGWGPGHAPPYHRWSAANPVTFPPAEHLTLEIGGNGWSAISKPARFKDVDHDLFYGLCVTCPKSGDDYLIASPEYQENVDSIIKTAKDWNHLEYVSLLKIPLTATNLRLLGGLSKLRLLSLESELTPKNILLLSKQPWLNRLNFLKLCTTTAKPINVDSVLSRISGSKSLHGLALENLELTHNSIESLQHCSNLTILYLGKSKIDDATLKALADISSLRCVVGLNGTITGTQIEWLSTRRRDLKIAPTLH